MRSALADATHGFNAKLAAVAATYGITAFSINWAASGSGTMLQSYVDAAGREQSRLKGISAALYTSASQQAGGVDRAKGYAFDGQVVGHLDVFLEFDDGEEVTADLTEDYADAVEDAVIQVLVDPNSTMVRTYFAGAVMFPGNFACLRGPIEQQESGYQQLLPFTFQYEVFV